MSAFLSVRKQASIELLADGSAYDTDDGVLAAIGSKIETLGDMSAAVIGRGHLQVMRGFARYVSGMCRTFDEVIDRFDEIMAEVRAIGFPYLGEQLANHEIYLAGWSETRDRPETFYEAAHGAWPSADGFLHDGARMCSGPAPQARRQPSWRATATMTATSTRRRSRPLTLGATAWERLS